MAVQTTRADRMISTVRHPIASPLLVWLRLPAVRRLRRPAERRRSPVPARRSARPRTTSRSSREHVVVSARVTRRRDAGLVAARAIARRRRRGGDDQSRGGRCSICGRCASTSRTGSRRTWPAPCTEFEYEIDGDRFLRLSRTDAERSMPPRCCRFPRRDSVEHVSGHIDRSRTRRSCRRSKPPARRSI